MILIGGIVLVGVVRFIVAVLFSWSVQAESHSLNNSFNKNLFHPLFEVPHRLHLCEKKVISKTKYKITYCADNGNEMRKDYIFVATHRPSKILWFDNGKKLKRKIVFNLKAQRTSELIYSWLENGEVIRQEVHRKPYGKYYKVRSQCAVSDMKSSDDFSKWLCYKHWMSARQKDRKTWLPSHIDIFDPLNRQHLLQRTILSDQPNQDHQNFVYFYPDKKEHNFIPYISGFRQIDDNENTISEYLVDRSMDIPRFLQQNTQVSDFEKQKQIKIYQSYKRRKVAIIDSGFDIYHKDLSYKYFNNPGETLNGLDDDGNGIIDDKLGFFVTESGQVSGNISERLTANEPGSLFPFSHGTHVASLATKNLDSFAIIGIGGNLMDPLLLQHSSKFLKKHNVEFANMSFGYGDRRSPMAPEGKSYLELKNLIKANDQCLFVVAAANSGVFIDGREKEYPASFDMENILTVGALEASEIDWASAESLKRASFSNFGSISVDIYAPGRNVIGANFNDTYQPMTGTSMAAPYALNQVLKVAEAFPSLSPLVVKKIMLLSAYIPDITQPLPSVSGGIVNLPRALKVAGLVAKQNLAPMVSTLKVLKEEAIKKNKSSKEHLENILARKKLWSDRQLLREP